MSQDSSPLTARKVVAILLATTNLLGVLALLCSTQPVVQGICVSLILTSAVSFCLLRNRLPGPLQTTEAVGNDVIDQHHSVRPPGDIDERLQLALKTSGMAFYDLNLVSNCAVVGPEYASMLGYPPATFSETKAKWLERLHPDDYSRVREELKAWLGGELPYFEIEYRLRTQSGNWLWVRSIGSIVARDPSGTAQRVLGTLKNIDDKKKAEESLEASALRYKALLRSATEGIHVLDPSGKVVEANPAFCNMLGYSLEEAMQLNVADWDAQWSHAELLTKIKQLTEQDATFETRHRRKDGTVFDVEVTATAVVLGEQLYVYASSRDITERKRSALKLRESEKRYRAIFDSAPDAVFLIAASGNDAGRIVACNDQAELMNGYHSTELTGRLITEFQSEQSLNVFTSRLSQILTGTRMVYDVEHQRKDGTIFPVEVTAKSIDLSGESYIIAFHRDMTDRRTAQRAISFERDRLRQIMDAQFAMVVVLTPSGQVVETNQTALRSTGVAREELVGQTFQKLGWLDQRDELQANFDIETAGRGNSVRRDLEFHFPTGELRIHDAVFSPLFNAEGEVANVIFFSVDVTERKQSASELRKERDFVNAILDTAGPVLVVLDQVGRIQKFNHAAEQLSGYTLAEVKGRFVWDTVLPSDVSENVKHKAFDPLTGNTPNSGHTFTNDWISRSGERRTLDWNNTTILGEHGELQHVVSIGIDVTDHRRVTKALYASELRLRTILDSEPECVKIINADCKLQDINAAGLLILGANSLAQVYGRDLLEFIDSNHQKSYLDCVAAVFRGESNELSFEIVSLDGRRLWLEQRAAPIWDPDKPGQVKEMLAVTRDISERVQSTKIIRENQKRLAEAQRIARVGSWDLNHMTGKLEWSDQVYDLLEVDPRQFVCSYENFLRIIHPDDRDLVDATYKESLTTRQPYCLTHRLLMADGGIKYVEEKCETDFDSDGLPLHSRGTVQDISTRVNAEQAIIESLREKEALLKEVHHRVKNNIQIFVSLLRLESGRSYDRTTREVLVDLQGRIQSMATLHELLYRSGTFASVDLSDYLTKLATQLFRSFVGPSRLITLELSLSSVQVSIDTAIPCGLLANELISNCLKHAFPNDHTGKVKIELQAAEDDAEWDLCISDNGIGLPKDFETRREKNLGVQLAFDLANQIGGSLVIGPWPSPSFRVRFPVKA